MHSAARHFVCRLLIVLAMTALGGCGRTRDTTTDPIEKDAENLNLIAIMTDDQGAWAMGAYGNDEIVTPHMDRLAAEGARFTNAFAVSGVCTPCRVSHLTGLYPSQVGLNDVPYRHPDEGLPAGVPTWPKVLQAHGYVTGLIGKWHLGRTSAHHPTRYGIDYFFGFQGGWNYPMNPVLSRDRKVQPYPGPTPDVLVDDAIGFVRENQRRPFALMLHFRAPHAPHGPVPEVDLAPFEGLDPTVPMVDPSEAVLDDDQEPADPEAIALHETLLKKKMITYYGSVHSIDRNLGRLIEELDALELTGKTIVLFTSDHGYMLGHRGLKGKGAAQPIRNHTLADNVPLINMYDPSMKVPLVIRWPGVVEPGTVIEELVSHIDTFPSVLGMLGIPSPEEAPKEGMDFAALLRGEEVSWRDALFAQYTPDNIGFIEFMRMVRTKRWKLVRTYLSPGGNQLFDLERDPEEKRNLYFASYRPIPLEQDTGQSRLLESHPHGDTVDRLDTLLTDWLRSIDDPALQLDADYHEAKEAARQRWQ